MNHLTHERFAKIVNKRNKSQGIHYILGQVATSDEVYTAKINVPPGRDLSARQHLDMILMNEQKIEQQHGLGIYK